MTWDQVLIFAILTGALILFAWGRWRYDLVAVLALLTATVTGLVDPGDAFRGFGHPAVVTVVAVLILSRGLERSGLVAAISSRLLSLGDRWIIQLGILTSLVLVTSAFINNIGALAFFLPVSLRISRETGQPPSRFLIPLAFASLLGGLTTLIGTPSNIIIATFRDRSVGEPFAMFDFLPAGGPVAVIGLVFVLVVGWRLVPIRRTAAAPGELFEVATYLTELRVPPGSRAVGASLGSVVDGVDVVAVSLVRRDRSTSVLPMFEILEAGDILVVEGDPAEIDRLLSEFGFRLGGSPQDAGSAIEDLQLFEAIVPPGAFSIGRSAAGLRLRGRHGVNLLGVARASQRIHERLAQVRFEAGDVLLLQGEEEAVKAAIVDLGCLPLAERRLSLGQTRRVALALSIFGAAIVATTVGLLPVELAFSIGAVLMVMTRLLTLDMAYRAVDLPIVVLLGAMLPVGVALETTGGAGLIAERLVLIGEVAPAGVVVAGVMVVVMLLSNIVNNAAAAVLAAPIGLEVAETLGGSPDTLLMAVAIGASLPLLTPIGHQSNLLVMAPGGYRFGDYWRLGLPVSLIAVVVGTLLILWAWPLGQLN